MSGTELLRSTIFHTPANPFETAGALVAYEDGGLAVRDGRILDAGDYASVRARHPDAVTTDWRGGCLLPGFVDTHVHFPQARVIGGFGRTLLDWLQEVALPEESRMADAAYASAVARGFLHQLASHGTTTALVFGAHFERATAALFEAAAAAGLRIVSGLVMSDRLLRPELHQSPEAAYEASRSLIQRYHGQGRLLYAVTPRFALSASEPMLDACRALMADHPGLRFQTHINENADEIAAVARLFPWAKDYLAVYEHFDLVGRHSVLAHGVWSTDSELERLATASATVAHCPCSNAALGSGIFPLRRYAAAGVRVALGTDVAGGTGFGILKEALQAYLMQRVTPDGQPLTPAHLLYLATRAGADALGLGDATGDFQPGKSADLVYMCPQHGSALADVFAETGDPGRRLAALFALGDAGSVREVRVEGARVYQQGAS